MGNAQWVLEVALLLLLAATLWHALRLERALGVLKRDRAVLEDLVQGFNDSTRQAESGIERLRQAADGAGRQMGRQIESAQKLRDDLAFLVDRSDRLAERLEMAVRSARMVADSSALPPLAAAHAMASLHASQARAYQEPAEVPTRSPELNAAPVQEVIPAAYAPTGPTVEEPAPRLRSQAERDLLRVLRAGR